MDEARVKGAAVTIWGFGVIGFYIWILSRMDSLLDFFLLGVTAIVIWGFNKWVGYPYEFQARIRNAYIVTVYMAVFGLVLEFVT